MQLYKTLFFVARQGHGATGAQAASAAPAIHYLQVADQVPRAARTVTVACSFNMPAGIHTGPLEPVSNCERLHLLLPRPSLPNSPKRAGEPVGEWCQLKTQSLWAFLFLVFIPPATLCPLAAGSKGEAVHSPPRALESPSLN